MLDGLFSAEDMQAYRMICGVKFAPNALVGQKEQTSAPGDLRFVLDGQAEGPW
jgi:hypothetical protein